MEHQDDWLEGVRRWYFGGEAPEGAEREEQLVWPATPSPQWPDGVLARCAVHEHAARPDACRN